MAVTPVLQTINAFDVTARNYEEVIGGATVYYCAIVSFSVPSSAEFIRSNKLSIYDSESGNIVATNIYNGKELVNKVPTNLTGIENKKYYYATIEIFDQIDGGGNSLGISNAKEFWCLPSPILQIAQPSADIQDYAYTDYNFVAQFTMYDSASINIADNVTNKIQSYQFDLYKGTYDSSVLEKSSGVIFNTGSTIDDNTYLINYIFAALENSTTYFIKLKIITEQGMVLENNSHLIHINATPMSFSIAKVTNKSCDGCIEIQSNVTNITGYTNADYNVGDGFIDLTNGEYVTWGYSPITGEREYSIHFPYSNNNGFTTSQWSFLIAGKNFVESICSPFNDLDNSYILELRDYDNTIQGLLYYRKDNTNIWCDFYVCDKNNVNKNMVHIKSNILTYSSADATLYILINCYDGWYNVVLSYSL